MHKISEMAAALAEIEELDFENAKRREKELRNLTQRLPFIPKERDGRADLYDFPSLAALRIVQIASDIGVSRPALAKLVSALYQQDRSDGPKAGTQQRVIDRLVAQAIAGDSFTVSIECTAHGDLYVLSGTPSKTKIDEIFRSAGFPEIVASIQIKADNLIRNLWAALSNN